MNKLLLVTLLILSVTFSKAALLKKPNKVTFTVFNELKQIEEHVFGKKILNTIALQLQNKSPLSDIAQMLAEIRQDLVIQQQEADQVHSYQEAECDQEINDYNNRIDVATATISSTEGEIATLKADIAATQGDINNKGIQLDILNQREVDLKDSRARDADAFTERQAQSQAVVQSLELVIEKFETLQPQQAFETAFNELARIGNTNPILALMQIASTFSPQALEKVKTALVDLKDDLEQSIVDDQQNEQEAIQEYIALLQELEETRASVAQAKEEAEIKLGELQASLQFQERVLAEAVAELQEAQQGKEDKQKQCEDWRNKWASDKEQREKQISIVKQVQQIIATKLEAMKDYLKEQSQG